MPLARCSLGKKQGWKWGDNGKCYLSKKDAIKQGVAIEGPDKFKQIMEKSKGTDVAVSDEEFETAVAELIDFGVEAPSQLVHPYLASVQAYITKKERDKVSTDDFGDAEGRKYPIRNQHDLESASKLIGRAPKEKQAAIKERIKRIAKRKGLTLPKSWE